MPLVPYNNNIPSTPNDPSADQPLMTVNTNAVDTILAVDHYSFNDSLGGTHKQVTLQNETIPTTTANQIAIYSKTSGQSQEFITSDLGTNEYQMTRFIDASFASFGNQAGANFSGWSFLPGGLIIQWGIITCASGTVVNFPVAFTTGVFSLQTTIAQNTTNRHFVYNRAASLTNFTTTQLDASGSAETSTFSWIAIGK